MRRAETNEPLADANDAAGETKRLFPADDSSAERRPALSGAAALGPLYAVLNYAGPLVRLTALLVFCFGHSDRSAELTSVLWPLIGLVATTLLRVPLTRLLLPKPAEKYGADALESSSSAQSRAVAQQALKFALLAAGAGAGSFNLDAAACGLRLGAESFLRELGTGLVTASLMCAVWSFVAAAIPPEPLVVQAGGTQDVSSATEDELLRQMPAARRSVSLALRCAAVAVEAYVDCIVLFVFLPALVDHSAPGAAPDGPSVAASILAAVAYGSQHLRFRGEWMLCAAFGAVLVRAAGHFGGSLAPSLAAAVGFAMYRHLRRTHENVRRFHGQ